MNEDVRIIAFNRAAEEITGIVEEKAIGQPCRDVLRASICHECCALQNTLETGQPIVNLAVEILDAHERRIPVTISSSVLRDKHGNVIGGVET